MKTLNRTGIALVATLLLSVTALASEGPPDQHHEGSFSAGQPGDATKPSRIVQVTMIESDGKMLFLPNRVEVKKDEQVKFMLRNNGEPAYAAEMWARSHGASDAEIEAARHCLKSPPSRTAQAAP
jgi:uncharacterized cupredoxin-like copper-binding protein